MIDTIVLLIPPQQFTIINPESFTPCSDMIYQHRATKAILNPSVKERKANIYKPRLTLSRRKNLQGISEIMLTIEVSLPKLIFGNNAEELQLKDFPTIIQKLHSLLHNMGIKITNTNLQNADIIAIHYSKNIVFTDGSTPFHYIQKIQQLAKPTALDSNRTNYRNAGHCFKYHCNTYEIVFYDKLSDVQMINSKGRKRAIDGDCIFDIKLLNKVRTKRKKFEILRMEVRLNKRSKIQQLCTTLNIKNDLTLRKLFRPAIARKVLLHYYITLLESKSSSLIDFKPLNDKALLTAIAVHNPQLKPKQILQFFGFKKALETVISDELKKIIVKEDGYSWNRLIKEIEMINIPLTQKPFEIIKQQITKYKPLKLRK